ncbi:hypothetical protein CONCODRAFT_14127 [Conidiobolus coronatus NRRL 28638]|uniref:Uncharacterized protein n=1 Tax=Conidiobolus coronatus (strain ATCC 28846 / CBS 209.66 / NRRL 28638) TaxID=796925 RepID=A0A137NPL4_CONC2|nr:hypothetical protein CONCODRAFT_14127 [Conidiobolus coronatus NRRL 28638]|eukprot:KXN64678.1 hypothetical protein CONCODRAFT_14127 [Conidiobolus coronatus NRRL 28638]
MTTIIIFWKSGLQELEIIDIYKLDELNTTFISYREGIFKIILKLKYLEYWYITDQDLGIVFNNLDIIFN